MELHRGLKLIAEDERLVVLAKAAGLLVHPAGEDQGPSVIELAGPGLWPVHRLDRETSGVLVLARSEEAAAHLGRSFAAGRVEKRYLALVLGVAHDKGVIRRPLLDEGQEQEAITRYRTLAVLQGGLRCSLLLVRPATGRPHQIRRHLAGIGHPVLGDRRYGRAPANRAAARLLGLPRLFLHAGSITLPHPADGQKRTYTAGLPPELVEVLLALDAPSKVLQRWAREPAAPPMTGGPVTDETD